MNSQPKKGRRRFLIIYARMLGSINQEPTDHGIQQREKREEHGQPANNLMKNHQEIKLFRIAIHVFSTRRHIAFLSVFVDVEPLSLDFWCNAQAN